MNETLVNTNLRMAAKKYALKPIDIRFLKAIDYIIAENKKLFGNYGESLLSTTVFGKRNIISKIRASQRGVTLRQIEQVATHFKLNYNYFFRDDAPLNYKLTSDNENSFIEVSGNNSGNIYNSKINVYIAKAKKIVDLENQDNYSKILDKIQKETASLEKDLVEKTQLLKGLQEEYSNTIIDLQKQLLEARKNESQYMKKYITLSENGHTFHVS
jgi:hypothetical protein